MAFAGTNQCQSPNVKYQKFIDPNERNLVAEVSCKELIIYEPIISNIQYPISQYPNILLYDCGVKLSIIRSLIKRGCRIIRIPWNYEIGNWEMFAFGKEMGKLGNYNINGIVISNGPGDPTKCDKTIEQIQKIITMKQCNNGTIPILGICLGNQILALAARAKTYKLKYGHRGQNQPVIENLKLQFKIKNFQNQKLISQYPNISISNYQKAFITSQNHGYAVDEKTLPKEWEVWFKNLNDNTVEGIKHKEQPWMSVQFHPEAAPGPTDTEWVFDEWLGLVQSAK
jgi:carbamoylphosphate synthase small subunit